MWKEIALAVAVLAPAAASRLSDARAPQPARAAAPVQGQTFAATCRDGQLIDSRPDPEWVRQSFNRDNCIAPPMPVALNGAKASRAQIVSAMATSKAYTGAAGAFQKCVADFMAVRTLTPNERVIENHRILASQKSVERAEAQTRVAINAFNATGSGCDD